MAEPRIRSGGPPGNHLPLRVEAGERALIHGRALQRPATDPAGPHGRNPVMSQGLKDKAADYLRALENRDWEGARALCAATATVWHHDGKGEETIEEYAHFVPAGRKE
ncbi:hypothetical protein ACFVUW_14860 [Streptomyces xiamenensis]|uniref:hypothetical protein n=1 Tax=Streptomyces xiamenensis TaxID=408015 RepID=UPI0036E198AA